MKLAIERDTSLIYESKSTIGIPVWPSPILLQVKIVSSRERLFKPERAGDLQPLSIIFREETYNSSSRIRRGRLYKALESLVQTWAMHPHPAMATEARRGPGNLKKSVTVFQSFRIKPHLASLDIDDPVFLLGAEHGFSIWSLVNVETSAIGEDVVILRARKSVGALPNIDREKILSLGGDLVLEFIDKLEEEIYRAGAESVVDRCREAITAILSTYLQSEGVVEPGNDLSVLANKVEGQLGIVGWSGKIVARLHARGKHAEQEKRILRDVTEQDAEFSVQAVGVILCDLGWASW